MLKNLNTDDFDYALPNERIAKYPMAERDSSLLLHFDGSNIEKRRFAELPNLLNSNDLLIFNNTKVIQARLLFRKSTGAEIEIFCLEPYEPNDYQLSFTACQSCVWKVMVGNLRRWKNETLQRKIEAGDTNTIFEAHYQATIDNMTHLVRFSWDNPNLTFAQILDQLGELPIPPYLNRKTETSDIATYQTTYAKNPGSVAAPTAGLHFTRRILQELQAKSINLQEITLHIGAGTFQPVKSEKIAEHTMHTEIFEIRLSVLEKIVENLGSIVAVGTTSMRTLESLYYIGCHIASDRQKPNLNVSQWEAYEEKFGLQTEEALIEIINYIKNNGLNSILAKTQIMIVPSFRFRIVSKLVTNFHQPRSTLLLLVSAFVGNDNRKNIYDFALNNDFRFLSYGDSSLLKNCNTAN